MIFKVLADFQGSFKKVLQKLPKEAPGRAKWSRGAPQETPGEGQESPRRPQEPPIFCRGDPSQRVHGQGHNLDESAERQYAQDGEQRSPKAHEHRQ